MSKKAKVITVTNQKGGGGKTTTAFAYAIKKAMEGKKVCMVDLDPQGNTSQLTMDSNKQIEVSSMIKLAVEYEIITEQKANEIATINNLATDQYKASSEDEDIRGIQHVLQKQCTVSKAIHHSAYENIDVIPTDVSLNLVPITNTFVLRQVTKELSELGYDYIIFDTPPALNNLLVSAFNASNLILIPIMLDSFNFKGSLQTIDYVKQIIDSLKEVDTNADIDYKIFINAYVSNLRINKEIIPILESIFNGHLLKTKVRRQNASVLNANNLGKHFMTIENSSRPKIADDFNALFEELER